MNSPFSTHLKKFFSLLTVFAVLSMLFLGLNNASSNAVKKNQEQVYKVGSKGYERSFSRSRLENLKTFLNYDLGVGFNDALECQNIFSDGFCLKMLDSALGREISKRYFSLIKDDFESLVVKHRGHRLYRHPSGKLSLLPEMKKYAKDLYVAYQCVQNADRPIDESLFHDYITLATEQRKFRPSDMKKLMQIFARDQHLGQDPILQRKNFALFQVKSNADMFGDAFMDLFAQTVMEGAAFARDHGYSTSFEEAAGIIGRLSSEALLKKYPNLESTEELIKIKNQFAVAMGLSFPDLVQAAIDTITFEKMLSDVDASIILDKMVVKKIYHDNVENLLVNIVQDHPNMRVSSLDDSLELDAYLEALGEKDGFLSVPSTLYDEETLLKKTPALCTKNYVIKIAKRTKKQVAGTISLKDVAAFQVSNSGWEILCKEFLFDKNLQVKKRFSFIRDLDQEQAKKVDQYSRLTMVKSNKKLIEADLNNQELVKEVFGYNQYIPSDLFGKDFDHLLLKDQLDNLSINQELSCYSQNEDEFYRVMLLGKPEKFEFATFDFAKKNNYLKTLVDTKLTALNKGSFNEEKRPLLLSKLVSKIAGREVLEAIQKAVEEKKFYSAHSHARLTAKKNGTLFFLQHPLLDQFKINEQKEVISRVGKTKEIALEKYFKMQPGEVSNVAFFDGGLAYYISLLAYKFDTEKVEKYHDSIKFEIVKEARNELLHELVNHFEENNMICIDRFKKRV